MALMIVFQFSLFIEFADKDGGAAASLFPSNSPMYMSADVETPFMAFLKVNILLLLE